MAGGVQAHNCHVCNVRPAINHYYYILSYGTFDTCIEGHLSKPGRSLGGETLACLYN